MLQGAYADALLPLQQLMDMLGDSRSQAVVSAMEAVYFDLPLCHFFVGQFPEAKKGFEAYLGRYKRGMKRKDSYVYRADALRFMGKFKEAIEAYENVMRQYSFDNDMFADLYSAIARCHLAQDDWAAAVEPLKTVYRKSPDPLRRNWAATLLTTAYLKEGDLDKIYALAPFILQRDSFASRSVSFNLAALETADNLFSEEYHRDALWVYRLVYPYNTVFAHGQAYLERLLQDAERIRKISTHPRRLMRLQERIGELEAEIEAMKSVEDYDLDLFYRISMGYLELTRYREAREIFLYLHETAEPDVAEESLFLAFRCSTFIRPWDRAFELGKQYMEAYPSGQFFDMLTLAMGQMYARLQDWPNVITHLSLTLDMSPRHESAAECMFLIGYASFMEEAFQDAIDWLVRMNEQYPGNPQEGEAVYWTGMAYLFDRRYEEGAGQFDTLLARFPDHPYEVDASFRRAVCDYGTALYEDADERLAAFVTAHPTNNLTAEAEMMRGDIAGALGRPTEAVAFYRRAMLHDGFNIEYYNHCAFQAGRILSDGEEFDAVRSHFRSYIKRNRKGSNIPLAVYWVGIALWRSGEEAGALRYYRQAVERYGGRPEAIGIDMIMDEWVGRLRKSPEDRAKQAWKELHASYGDAVSKKNDTLALRFGRMLLYNPWIKPSTRQDILRRLRSETYLAAASPAVLQAMMDRAQQEERNDFAFRVANYIIDTFTETDYALDARMTLARHFVAQADAEGGPSKKRERFEEAIKHLEVVKEVYATSTEAATALLMLGSIRSSLREYGAADENYKAVLGVRGWRNLWPEALYGRGECARARKQHEAASAYYERIYVLYGHHSQWVARAYLRRAQSLIDLFQPAKAREVLTEMLANKDLADLPETQEARDLMKKVSTQI